MATAADLMELTADGSAPSSAAFNWSSSASSRAYFLPNPNGSASEIPGLTIGDLQSLIVDVMGTTTYGVNTAAQGKLNRALPKCDPDFPWLYASAINFKGRGTYQKVGAQQTSNTLTTMPFSTLWTNYDVAIEFTQRPYAIFDDSAIAQGTASWYDSLGGTQSTPYYPEWQRFCDFDFIPQDEWVEQQRGSAYFLTGTGDEPGSAAQATTQQSIRMLMPDSILRFLWVGVPLRYITSANSYLQKFRGRINQNAWNGPSGAIITNPQSPSNPNGTSGDYPPGSLLYVGFKPKIYMPVLPVSMGYGGRYLTYTRLCDIEIVFLYTARDVTDAPTQPTNKNIVVTGGWNCQPYLPKRQFFYCYNRDLAGNQNPFFYSFPIELLWTDPDADTAYKGDG